MADLTIPGVNSQYGTEKMIEGLMKIERIPLTRKEEQIETFETEKETWQNLNRQFSLVRQISQELYGFQNPFGERIAESSDDSVVTATAKRDALSETRDLKVVQTAQADRFVTGELDPSEKIPAGKYLFKVGEKEILVRFRGGSQGELAEMINRRGRGFLKASTVKNRPDSQIFVLTSLKEGAKNRLTFEEDALPWALKNGMIEEKPNRAWSSDETTEIGPGENRALPVNFQIPEEGSYRMEFTVTQTISDPDEYTPPPAPPGLSSLQPGVLSLDGITIRNEDSRADLPEWKEPPAPPFREDLNPGGLRTSESALPLGDLPPEGSKTYTVELPPGSRIETLDLNNRNTHRTWDVSGLKIYDPNQRDGYAPKGAVSVARDAEMEMDGITIVRESNTVDDLIPGLTLNLHRSSPREITLTVEPDKEAVKNKLIEFVFTYNKTIEELQILTSTDPGVITELNYLSDEEKKAAKEKLGSFQGDLTLVQMKNRLQTIVMEPQKTDRGRELALLSQIGISTNTQAGGGFDVTKMRGYLEISEETLNQALDEDIEAVKQLFGRDSDGDFVTDAGIGYRLADYAKTFTQQGGILAGKISTIDGRIDRTKTEIEDLKVKLEETEFQLKRKYGMMEGTLRSLEKSSDAINNFNRQNSGGNN